MELEEIIRLEQVVISTNTWAQAVKVEECDAQACKNTQHSTQNALAFALAHISHSCTQQAQPL